MREIFRVLSPGGFVFFTVPFVWPLHDAPHDEYRYTPYALRRHLEAAGFRVARLEALGGWNASLAQLLGLWARRRPMPKPLRSVVSFLLWPIVWLLHVTDRRPDEFGNAVMYTGLAGRAEKPG
jgi:hypothetical protein